MKKPERMFRARGPRPAGGPEMPPEERESLDRMRRIREVIDPSRPYRLLLPSGRVLEATVALQDAIDRGEPPGVLKAAFDRLDATM
jgi:hypothetical protein